MVDVIKDQLDEAALLVVFQDGDDPALLKDLSARLARLSAMALEHGLVGLRDRVTALADSIKARKTEAAVDWEAITGELDGLQVYYRSLPARHEPQLEASAAVPEFPAPEMHGESGAAQSGPLDELQINRLVDLAGELQNVQAGLRNVLTGRQTFDLRLAELLQRLRQVGGAIQSSALALQTLPVHGLFEDLARYAARLGQLGGRQIEAAVSGTATAVDRRIIAGIGAAMRTMIRCCLEFAAGSPGVALMRLQAARTPSSVRLELHFAGLQWDTGAVAAAAGAAGLTADNTGPPEWLLHPDFPLTARRLPLPDGSGTLYSAGKAIEAMGATVDYRLEASGIAVTVRLPSAHTTIEGLLIRSDRWKFLLPTSSIREIFLPSAGRLSLARDGFRTMLYRDRLYTAARLERLLGVSAAAGEDGVLAVIVDHEDAALCLLVDELLGKEEVMVKSLGPTFSGMANLAGGAILADGRVGLVIDVAGLCRSLHGAGNVTEITDNFQLRRT